MILYSPDIIFLLYIIIIILIIEIHTQFFNNIDNLYSNRNQR